jgi:hypothetical protein
MRLEDFIIRAKELVVIAENVLTTKRRSEIGSEVVDKGQFHCCPVEIT